MNKTGKILLTLLSIIAVLLTVSCEKTAQAPQTGTQVQTTAEASAQTSEPDRTGAPTGGETPTADAGDCEHSYVFDRFEWTEDGKAGALLVCEKDASHRMTAEASVTGEITREATGERAGEKILTARYGEESETRTVSYMANEVTLTVYAVNDFHGAVNEESGTAGLAKFATYFKEKGEDGNTLLIDSGDTWQGSIASNYNGGLLISDIYNYIGMDAKTLGNHEFDWSPEIIARNASRFSYGRTTPFLAANIYDFDITTGVVGKTQQENLGKKSVIRIMDSGLKVGIVGAIDSDCISSINSLNMLDLAFTDHVKAIRTEAAALRAAGCDVVICSIHGDEDCVRGRGLEEYVDLVLCAHSHQLETSTENGLLYAQFMSNGEYFGRITLTYSAAEKTCRAQAQAIPASEIKNAVKTVDPTVEEIISGYEKDYRAQADTVVAKTVYGTFGATAELPNLMCRAIYDAATAEGYDVCLTYVNKARTGLRAGTWTYEDLYQAFPFDDLVFITDVTGREILNQIAKYNYIYRAPDFTEKIDPGATYTIACIDYLLFHNDASRNFNYFPTTAGKFSATLKDNYRVILRNWLIENGYADGKILSSAYYSSDITEYNPKLLK